MIKYVDFNNNVYTIRKTSIHYLPIRPENSSSGIYSGGEESNTPISEEQFNRLSTIASSIISNKEQHLQTRKMLTAILSVTMDGKTERCIISRSEAQRELVKMLKELIADH